jgi:hypothetical protein
MEDHFDRSPELETSLAAKSKNPLLEIARSVSRLAKVTFTRQSEPLGLGHAVLMAKEIVGNEPFAGERQEVGGGGLSAGTEKAGQRFCCLASARMR